MNPILDIDFQKLSPMAQAEIQEQLRQQELARAAVPSGSIQDRPIGRMLDNPHLVKRDLGNGRTITEPAPKQRPNSHYVLIPKLVDRIK